MILKEKLRTLIGLEETTRTGQERDQLLDELIEKERKRQKEINGKHAALFEKVLAMLEDKTKEEPFSFSFLRNTNDNEAQIEIERWRSTTGCLSYLIKSDIRPPFDDRELGFALISQEVVGNQPVYTFLYRFLIIDTDKLVHCLPNFTDRNPPEKRRWCRESLSPSFSLNSSLPCYYSHPDYEEALVKNLEALIKDIPSWTPVK